MGVQDILSVSYDIIKLLYDIIKLLYCLYEVGNRVRAEAQSTRARVEEEAGGGEGAANRIVAQ